MEPNKTRGIPLEFQEKIDRAKKTFLEEEDQKALSEIEKNIRRGIVQSELRSHPIIEQIISESQSRISAINTILQYDETLSDLERKALFKERSVHQFWVDRFVGPDVDSKMAALSAYLDERL